MNIVRKTLFALALLLGSCQANAAQTVILASGQTVGTSSTVVVTSSGTLTMYPGSIGGLPIDLPIYQVANGVNVKIGDLTPQAPRFVISHPGSYIVTRPDITATATSVGVVSDLSAAAAGGGPVTPTGQTNMAGAVSVVLPTDQSSIPVAATLAGTLPAFAATPTFNCGTGCGAANGSVATTGAAVPASGTYLAANIGGNLTGLGATANGLKTDGSAVTQPVSGTFWQATQPVSGTFWQATQPVSGSVTANLGTLNGAAIASLQPGFGTAGSANANVVSVQGIASGTVLPVSGTVTANAGSGTMAVSAASLPLPAGAATAANQPTAAAQGSTTSGQLGGLDQAAVTTAAPSYTNGQTNPLSLTPAGALRTDASATTQPVNGTVTANLGTLNGAATAAGVATVNTTLGTPAQQTGATVGLVAGVAKVGVFTTDSTTPGTTDLVHTLGQGASSTQTGTTVTTHLVWQTALATSATRKGCMIQNNSTDKMWVFFGANGSATSSNSIALLAGQSLNCGTPNGAVANDNIAITSNAVDAAAYVVVSQ